MDKYRSIIFLLASVLSIATGREIDRYGYYWRSYDGTIPADALVAGYGSNEPVYVGQVYVGDKVIPGEIYRNDYNLYYEWDEQAWSTNKNVKILCTEQPNRFRWRATSNAKLFRSNRNYLIEGGYQQGLKTYIGRVQVNGETIVGKVMCNYSYCLALYVVNNGKQVEYHSYEVLEYVPFSVEEATSNELLQSDLETKN